MDFPSIDGLQLGKCCEESLVDIKRRLKNRKILQAALPVGFFATMFIGPNTRGPGSILSTYWSVGSADFVTFAKAMQQTGHIGNPQMRDICAYEALFNHPTGKLNKFWKAMADIF